MSYISLLDLFGYADILLAAMLLITPTPVPPVIAHAHAAVLFVKGASGVLPFNIIPMFLGPLVVPVGAFVDIVSVALILLSQPPMFAEYKGFVALLVMVKGVFTAASFF
jgi:hypothetical protein